MRELKGEEYLVTYDQESHRIVCKGSFRLRSREYVPITALLQEVASSAPPVIRLDLRQLRFLNSSGINMLSKFVIKLRKNKRSHVIVQGCREFPWQRKSLKNLKRLMPTLELEIE